MKAIFTFHSIDDSGSVLSYPPRLLSRLLENLAAANIPVLDLDTLLAQDTRTGVALTFDDGMQSVATNALPILRDHRVPAHIYITPRAIDEQRSWPHQPAAVPGFAMLNWDQVDTLQAGGFSIDAHTLTHPDMRLLDSDQIREECECADAAIATRTGRSPVHFAYPFGYHNRRARDYCRRHYRSTVTTELRFLAPQEDPAALPRLDTYYLQKSWLLDRFDGPLSRGYLALRWLMRTLRGSHCRAGYDG